MKSPAFIRTGWFLFPASVAGWCVCLAAAAFCVTVFIAVDRHSHSVSDTFYGVYPYFLPTFLVVDWVARRMSEAPTARPAEGRAVS